jgi:hypothetical protein
MKLFKRKDRFIAMQQFRDSTGYVRLYCMTKKKVFEYDVERKAWRVISATIAQEIEK